MNKPKMLAFVISKRSMSLESEFYLAPQANPEFYDFTIGALFLCCGDYSKFGHHLQTLIEKSIEHDTLMAAAMPQVKPVKPSFFKRIFGNK